jgi:Dolichyl-phosphate-mannose-protein mannosyltransferase
MQEHSKTADRRGFGAMVQAHGRWFFWFSCAAIGLRLLFVLRFPGMTTDGEIYGELAKNWLQHHVYGLNTPRGPAPTYIRLPGYPAFLAGLWAIFGVDHYNAARFAQAILDVLTCFVTADLARRVMGNPTLTNPVREGDPADAAAKWAFALAALCPFLANYTAVPLTETLAIFLAALALDLAIAGLAAQKSSGKVAARYWTGCGLAIALGIYLRPDAGIILIAIGGALLWRLVRGSQRRQTLYAGVVLGLCALLPLAPWTVRNWRVFHEFMPLAPPHANAPDEYYAAGFDRWMRTWLADFASMEDISFRVDTSELDIHTLPSRAFDNDEERSRTAELFDRHNENVSLTPELDGQFDQLARERIRRNQFRYYLELPLLRTLDLWLRPRTEMLPLDSHWWRWRDDPHDFTWALVLAAINAGYVGLALVGLARRWRQVRNAGVLVGFVVLRTVILTAITFPEPRYVLECYPVVIVLAAAAFCSFQSSGVSLQVSTIGLSHWKRSED